MATVLIFIVMTYAVAWMIGDFVTELGEFGP